MAEETSAFMEQMEKNIQERQEILVKDREEHREQMAHMMQVIMRLSREIRVVDDAGFVNTPIVTQGVTEGPMHPASLVMPKVGTPHCLVPPMVNAIPDTYPPLPTPMPMVNGIYLFMSDELKEIERKKVEFMMQLKNTKTQQQVNLIEERLKAIGGNN